jgi:predicted aspartyl protease
LSLIRLRYKSYKGLTVPIISVGINHAQIWYPVEAFVDSGATYSIFTDQVAATIGLEYKTGSKIFVQVGDGGLIAAYLHNLTIQLGKEKLVAPLGFSDRLGVGFNLLGRTGIFSYFKVCFDEKNRVVSFEKQD